jgi:PTS system nitrogen regulatory IIA component
MKFEEFVCFDATVPDLQSRDRDGVIAELVSSLVKAKRLPAKSAVEITKAVIKRETEASTGMGKGVAIPHVKHAGVKDVVAVVGQSSNGIDFAALDEQPVYAVILLVSPLKDPDRHLQAMENVFKHLQSERFRKFLRQCRTQEMLEDLLKEADESPSW